MSVRVCALSLVALVLSSLHPATAGAEAAAGRLSGLVEDPHGVALPASQLRLTDASGVTTVSTDERGRYSATLQPGIYDLAVSAMGDGVPLEARVRDVEVGKDSRLNVVLAGQPIQTSILTGTLRDAEGAPIPAAYISAGGRTVTDEEGAFVLEVPSGRYPLEVSLWLESGPVNAWVDDFDLTRDTHLDLTLPLIAIDISVRDEAGSPLRGAEIGLSSDEICTSCPGAFELIPGARTGRHFDDHGETDGDGHLRLVGLPTSSLSLSARMPGSTAYKSVQRTGLSAKASKSFDVVLPTRWHAAGSSETLSSPTAPSPTLSGSLDFAGMINPDRAGVNLFRGETFVAGTGDLDDHPFALSAPPGSYTLGVHAASWEDDEYFEWRPEVDRLSLSTERFDLEADRHQDLRLPLVPLPVRVLDHEGQPVPGAWVQGTGMGDTSGELFPGAPTTGSFTSDRWTDASGVATLQVLPGVAVTVSADPPGGRGLPAEVKVEGSATSVEIRLEDAPTLRGHISTADGRPVRPTHGFLRPESGGPDRRFAFADDGTYAVSALPGRYRIALDTEDDFYRPSDDAAFWHVSSEPFDMSGDTTLDLTIPGDEGGEIREVDSEGRRSDGFPADAQATSVGDFELAPGIRATSTASIFGPGGGDPLYLPVLVPSRVSTSYSSDSGDVKLPAVYVAPGELTVVAHVLGSSLPTPIAPAEIRGRADGDTSATVAWSPPQRDSGSPVLGYLVSRDHGRPVFVKAPATTAALTGLSPGSTYRFSVAAVNRHGIGEARGGDPIVTSGSRPAPPAPPTPAVVAWTPAPATLTVLDGPPRSGYWMVASDGRVYAFGDAGPLGQPVDELASAEVVDVEPSPSGNGYWVLDERGRVFAYGDAVDLGDAALDRGEKATSLSATGRGYWVFTSAGRVVAFGDAQHHGDMAGVRLNGAVLDSVATPSGRGYYMVASDGGVFTFGDAKFAGSMGDKRLNAPVQSLVPDSDGDGYWLVASDGGAFAFDAPFRGSMGGTRLNKPVVGMVRYGNGYLMVGADGGIFNFSDLHFAGSLGDQPPTRPVVAVAALS